MNCAVISGNLTKDIELNSLQSGSKYCRFCVGVRRDYKNEAGEYESDFINCVAWNKTAEFLSQYFKKGQAIELKGSIQTRSWDGQDGQKRYATEIKVENVGFLGSKKENQTNNKPAPVNNKPATTTTVETSTEAFPTVGPEDDLPF